MNIFPKLRHLIGVRYEEYSSQPYGKNVVASAFTCMWCLSTYVGAVLLVLYILFPGIIWLYVPLALSASAVMIEGFFIVR